MAGAQDKSLGIFMAFGMTPGNVPVRRLLLNANGRDFAMGDNHGHLIDLRSRWLP